MAHRLLGIYVFCGSLMMLSACRQNATPSLIKATNTPVPVFALPAHISTVTRPDNRLTLMVENLDSQCQPIEQSFILRFIFKNISTAPLTLNGRLAIAPIRYTAYGDIIPFIFTEMGQDVQEDVSPMITWLSAPFQTVELPKGSEYQLLLEFSLPLYSTISTLNTAQPTNDHQITPGGRYFVTFLFVSDKAVDSYDLWGAAVQSNQIEICVQNPTK